LQFARVWRYLSSVPLSSDAQRSEGEHLGPAERRRFQLGM
jgi:hypothetical protein